MKPSSHRSHVFRCSLACRSGWEIAAKEGIGSEAHRNGEGGAGDLVELQRRVSRGSSSVVEAKGTKEVA
ncbi:hypothetical protein B296_00042765 [Ensete ventricosum]|uniref:Uncharacterized protein n=1 Tax=Ensete ventricosum TaxID=4639 RepID=A0A426Z3B0_ENSVE|nr:hypothetical protein B296_00042765 [Ensete ventricosum]